MAQKILAMEGAVLRRKNSPPPILGKRKGKGGGENFPLLFCGASTETADSHPSSFGAEVEATAAEEGGTPPHLTLTVWATGGGGGGREKITFQSPFVLISDTFPHTLSHTFFQPVCPNTPFSLLRHWSSTASSRVPHNQTFVHKFLLSPNTWRVQET